jgi:hypothetical protein
MFSPSDFFVSEDSGDLHQFVNQPKKNTPAVALFVCQAA